MILKLDGKDVSDKVKKGDLIENLSNNQIQIEVKCVSSNGPITFGPNEKWNKIYFVNATQPRFYKVFELNMCDDEFSEILKVNKTQNMNDQRKEKRRPRVLFQQIKEQFKNKLCLVKEGDIEDLFNIFIN
jgi:hypothetical protein